MAERWHVGGTTRNPLFDEDDVALANSRYDRTHPKRDGMFQEPRPQWMDHVAPDFTKNLAEPYLTRGVWDWINRSNIVLLSDLV